MERQPKRSLILKALDCCRSLTNRRSSPPATTRQGRFTVHVGPNQERFVIKTECIGHPLFQALLDQAELAYGFASPGPLQLPCDVDLFRKVMCEMEKEIAAVTACGAGFCKCYSAGSRHQLLISSSRLIVAGSV